MHSFSMDDHEYVIHPLPVETSMSIFLSVGKAASPLLSGGDVSEIFTSGGLDDAAQKKIVTAFKNVTFVDGKPLKDIFDAHFLGRYPSLLLWIVECVKHEYGDLQKKLEPLMQ